MGRYITGSGAGGGGAGMRNERHVITASNPALPVPAWAKAARISGVGGGGGGAVVFGGVGAVNPGGCAGIAHNALMPLIGVASLAVVIGAGGVGKAAGSSGEGGAGGATTITANGLVMTLEGANGNTRGQAYMGTHAPSLTYAAIGAAAGLIPGYLADTNGTPSPYGGGGARNEAGNGGNATGYGAGGGGGIGGKGGDGSPGLAIIEFLEAA